jgi:hypothetical protein
MSILSLRFEGVTELVHVHLPPTKNADFFQNYLTSFNRPADSMTVQQPFDQQLENFLHKAQQAKEIFNFDWNLNSLTQENFNIWHRDIENFDLSKYPPCTQEKDHFAIDLHSALHMIENRMLDHLKPKKMFQQTSCSIKWFAPSLPWPEIPKFKSRLEVEKGDIIVDYPHVGKSPWTSFENNDTTHLEQSCRLPDMCAPGFYISLVGTGYPEKIKQQKIQQEKEQLILWYQENITVLEKMFTQEQMLTYDGVYCIGKIQDLKQIDLLNNANLTSVSIA